MFGNKHNLEVLENTKTDNCYLRAANLQCKKLTYIKI
jgi:hypothetical protein